MCKHFVRFYDTTYPADEAADYIADGLRAGLACIVILVKAHLDAVHARLSALGIDTDPAGPHAGDYSAFDSDDTLAQLMVGGRLDEARAIEAFGHLLSQAADGGARAVRLVGDPAAKLYASGHREAGLALERLVDKLAKTHGASVLCAYPVRAFYRDGDVDSLFRISAEHAELEFPATLWVDGQREPSL